VLALIMKREVTRGRSEKKVWPSCAGGVTVLENDVTADSTPEDGGLPVRCCWPHERTDEVKKPPLGADSSKRVFAQRWEWISQGECMSCAFQPYGK
jgi:hypothetical protein